MSANIVHRSKITALLLAILSLIGLPGIGHLFAARFDRAVIFLAIIFIAILLGAIGGMKYFLGAALIYSAFFLIWIYLAYDGYKLNTAPEGFTRKWYNKWYFYIVFTIGIWWSMQVFEAFIANYLHFRVAAESNSPTLQKGDIVMAQMNYGHQPGYFITKISSLFGSRNTRVFIFSPPKYNAGSYILFNEPNALDKNKKFIRKIIAISGDTYNQKGKQIKVPENNALISMNNDGTYELIPYKEIQGKILYVLFSTNPSRIGLRVD